MVTLNPPYLHGGIQYFPEGDPNSVEDPTPTFATLDSKNLMKSKTMVCKRACVEDTPKI